MASALLQMYSLPSGPTLTLNGLSQWVQVIPPSIALSPCPMASVQSAFSAYMPRVVVR